MVTAFNRKRVLIDIDIESIMPSKIIMPGKPKKKKTATGTVVKCGSEVRSVKPGDKVSLHNEGIVWGIAEQKKIFRIINEPSIIQKLDTTKTTS